MLEKKSKISFTTSMLVLLASGVLSAPAYAGAIVSMGEDKSISVGIATRASYSSVEDGAPNGTSRSNDMSLDSARILLGGSLNKYVKGMLNTEKDIAGSGFQVIDANVQVEVAPELTIWLGRFLSPSDRANMAGPYYSLGGGYWAGIASRYGYNGGYIGRDDGVAAVGSLANGMVNYSVGVFEGNTTFMLAPVTQGARTGSDGLMYAGRVQAHFWDTEPGYYGTGNYLGAKNILSVGLAARSQSNGAYSATKTGDYQSYNLDFLLETKDEGSGSFSAEAAAYHYDTDDVFTSEQGSAYSGGLAYLFGTSAGKVQPFVRYQQFNADNNVDSKKADLGVNWILAGYNTQLAATYSQMALTGTSKKDAFSLTAQYQF